MDILEQAVRAYNFLMFLVQVILDAFFGNVYLLGGAAVAAVVALVVAVVLLRRRAPGA